MGNGQELNDQSRSVFMKKMEKKLKKGEKNTDKQISLYITIKSGLLIYKLDPF